MTSGRPSRRCGSRTSRPRRTWRRRRFLLFLPAAGENGSAASEYDDDEPVDQPVRCVREVEPTVFEDPCRSDLDRSRVFEPEASDRGIVAVRSSAVKGWPNVRFGSKADIPCGLSHVRFAPESGHQSCPRHARLSSSSDFAIFTAIRRASSRVSSFGLLQQFPAVCVHARLTR